MDSVSNSTEQMRQEGGNCVSDQYANEPILDVFIFETTQNIEQLEQIILSSERENCYTQSAINEIFRIMHTIKGSAGMMLFNEISTVAHALEDVFFFLREVKPQQLDCSTLSDLMLEGMDFVKLELEKIKNGDTPDGQASSLIANTKKFLSALKNIDSSQAETSASQTMSPMTVTINSKAPGTNAFKATILFEEGCEMENIRAFTIVHNLKEIASEISFIPQDIVENEVSAQVIREQGFQIFLNTDSSFDEVYGFLNQTAFLKDLKLEKLGSNSALQQCLETKEMAENAAQAGELATKRTGTKDAGEGQGLAHQSIISVNVAKLDNLMDLVGELVIAEAMVTQNPDLDGLELDSFQKAARQLRKISGELQDVVMSIRMVPLAATFQKMNRVVRDMAKKLDKEVRLNITGAETEVDKNIIEHISDPLMHLVRNAIDHGIESNEERTDKGKELPANVSLEAKNSGSDVLIVVKDDGKGLNKDKILQLARENGLLYKPESEMSDREIYNLIFLPGFSTKDKVTEFSGRGVGMDVVTQNIGAVGGTVLVDSVKNEGTTITLKIPLTLAIIDSMIIRVGESCYTLPTTGIKESFRAKATDTIVDPDGNEMIMVRGQCYPILRLHQLYNIDSAETKFSEGIFIMLEQDEKAYCLFVDELLGQQSVVVKALPNYIKKIRRTDGLAGCTLLGDGSISLILDIGGLIDLGRQKTWRNYALKM